MKRYLVKIFIFFFIILIVDFVLGNSFQYMNDHSKGGGTYSRYYVTKESHEEVLVFGSSRAKHHYVPDIIEKEIGLSCYNTGEDGNGIIYCYGVLQSILRRYTPKLIIYDISLYDIYKDDNMKYLDFLKPYYYEPGIDSLFWAINPKTRFMMYSNLYRFNTNCINILGSFLFPVGISPKGYSPLYKTMPAPIDIPNTVEGKGVSREVDSLKCLYFEKFIGKLKENGIPFVCCISPYYKGKDYIKDYSSIENILSKYNLPLLSFANDKEVVNDYTFFKDRDHLNDKGAKLFTNQVIDSVLTIYPELRIINN